METILPITHDLWCMCCASGVCMQVHSLSSSNSGRCCICAASICHAAAVLACAELPLPRSFDNVVLTSTPVVLLCCCAVLRCAVL